MTSIGNRTFVEVQEGGAGASGWQPIMLFKGEKSAIVIPAPSGGEVEYTAQYATDHKRGGKIVEVGVRKSGTPAPITGELQVWDDAADYLKSLSGKFNVRVREFTGEYSDPNNYLRTRYMLGALSTNPGNAWSGDWVNEIAAPGDQQMRTYALRASMILEERQPALTNISGTVTALAINKVISIGYERAAGEIAGEATANDGNQDFIAVTDKDVSNLPHLLWTDDGGSSWTDVTLTGMTNGDAVDVTKAGAYIVVAMIGAGGGIAYAKWSDIKAGTATWVRATGVSAGTVVNCILAVTAKNIYAGGQSGKIYRSTDGGFTFELWNDGLATAQNLLQIAFYDQSLVWLGGASGALVKIARGVASAVAVTGIGTDDVTALAVPEGRGNEVFVGTSAGDLFVSVDEGARWDVRTFDGSGSGTIADLQFSGHEGQFLWLLQTNGSAQTRILRDRSGGYAGADVEIVSTYTGVANSGMNSIAASDPTTAVVVGEVNSAQGFIGRVAARAAA